MDTILFTGRDGMNPAHIFVRNEYILKINSLNQAKNVEIFSLRWYLIDP